MHRECRVQLLVHPRVQTVREYRHTVYLHLLTLPYLAMCQILARYFQQVSLSAVFQRYLFL